jgi:hypothetical protein
MDNNKIVTITYKDLTFEVDVWNGHIFFPEEIIRLFPEGESHIEVQPTCLFLNRLADNWDMKSQYNKQINYNGDINNIG